MYPQMHYCLKVSESIPKGKYNCIWIMCDQLRQQAIGINGDPNVSTPNIDLLAKTGLNFTNAVGGFPLCCPFRGSMITSEYPHKCVPGHEYPLPVEMTTVADVFNDNGYHTAYVGKWHLDGRWYEADDGADRPGKHYVPADRRGRFNYWMGYENNNSQWNCYVHGHKRDKTEVPFTRLEKYETDALTDIFLDHLDEVREDPFFAVLSVQPPHNPYIAPPEYMANHSPQKVVLRKNVPKVDWVEKRTRADLSGAYAMVENLDYNVGRIVEWLREKKMLDNTHIIFFSDHGDMHGSHGLFHKTNPYEESIKIPFIISGGEEFHGNWISRNVKEVINHVDIAPTSLGLCGIEVPDVMKGTDFSGLRLASDKKTEYPKSAYIQSVIPTSHGDSEEYPWRGVVTDDGFKYVSFENLPWMMFDLNKDPYEQVNLARNTMFKKKADELKEILQEWIDRTEDNFDI